MSLMLALCFSSMLASMIEALLQLSLAHLLLLLYFHILFIYMYADGCVLNPSFGSCFADFITIFAFILNSLLKSVLITFIIMHFRL